jgi:hypothetical protein
VSSIECSECASARRRAIDDRANARGHYFANGRRPVRGRTALASRDNEATSRIDERRQPPRSIRRRRAGVVEDDHIAVFESGGAQPVDRRNVHIEGWRRPDSESTTKVDPARASAGWIDDEHAYRPRLLEHEVEGVVGRK